MGYINESVNYYFSTGFDLRTPDRHHHETAAGVRDRRRRSDHVYLLLSYVEQKEEMKTPRG